MNKAAFLDRDGVINQKAPTEDEYITSWEEMKILPGVAQGISLLNRTGFRVVVVSNQRSVAKGLITIPELEFLHRRMCDELAHAGAKIDDIYYCPHELRPPCACRKPEPGMLLEAARAHDIDLTISWMIGDSENDVEAGRRAGCRTARVLPSDETRNDAADIVARSLLEAAQQILSAEGLLEGIATDPFESGSYRSI
jgi:histidinol-phosphate phosphatase family protein